MPEASKDASLLIAISYQALNRSKNGDNRTIISNCTVAIVFAGFFIEANLNQIINDMNKTEEMKAFLKKDFPGMKSKLAWFYLSCVNPLMKNDKSEFNRVCNNLGNLFPGFKEIYSFRNNISHGSIDPSIANLEGAEKLRKQAKAIVDELFNIAAQAGFNLPRVITYDDAIG